MTGGKTQEQSTQQPAQAQANGPQQQASGTQSPLSQALQQQLAQSMQPILDDLQQQVVQAVRQQMEEGLQQPLQGGQSQDGQPAAEQSPLQAVFEQARAVVQQVIAWIQHMLQAVRDWLSSSSPGCPAVCSSGCATPASACAGASDVDAFGRCAESVTMSSWRARRADLPRPT